LDYTIGTKNVELCLLKKEEDIAALTLKYKKDLKEEENHQLEQAILQNLIDMIKAPELCQHEGLEAKFKYLKGLPEFSSIKIAYLKPPDTKIGITFLNQLMTTAQRLSLDPFLKDLKNRMDPESGDENTVSNTYRIETEFNARLAAFNQGKSEKSEKIENELKGLKAQRSKFESIHIKTLPRSRAAVVRITNKCEKGTIIKGKIAEFIVKETLYNVEFKEMMSPTTNIVSIIIETC